MYGGTAKTYANWKQLSEPYEQGNAWYIKIESPKGRAMVVRWYKDEAHNKLMKHDDLPPFFTVFGFSTPDDTINCVKEKDLTAEECLQVKRDPEWRFGIFFGGIWYSKQPAPFPSDKFFVCTWPQFFAEGRKIALQSHYPDGNPWLQEENSK